jgi:hypothetical protein
MLMIKRCKHGKLYILSQRWMKGKLNSNKTHEKIGLH